MSGRRWVAHDRHGNEIYLTQERWEHITNPYNHPEMEAYEEELRTTIRQGKRKQDTMNPQKYRYRMAFDGLAGDNTHIVVMVLFRFQAGEEGVTIPNNYIVTAYQKEIW